MKYCIVCSNLHGGGGIQVAASMLASILQNPAGAQRFAVLASSEVDRNLRELNPEVDGFSSYEVLDHHGISTLWSGLGRKLKQYDAVFTVFGPLYVGMKPAVSVVGFAQPWIIYPENEIYSNLGWRQKLVTRFKYKIQSFFFKRADLLIVELEHVRQGLIRQGVGTAEKVRVVHNCLSALFGEPDKWLPVKVPRHHADFRLGFVGRNYPHKNIGALPQIRKALRARHGLDVRMYVTFTDAEWAACSADFRSEVINVGSLTLAQCPAFYQAMDGVVFPSLLECFSATPLEALAMERPLFASDRAFIRDVCGSYARYFNPLDPENAADCIAAYIRCGGAAPEELARARDHAMTFSSNAKRTLDYIECIEAAVAAKN